MAAALDLDVLREAALEVFEQALSADDRERSLRNLMSQPDADPARIDKLVPGSRFSPGYRDQVTYLLWLRETLQVVDLSLTAEETDGLRMLSMATAEFERRHPACPRCGVRQYTTKPFNCRSCGTELG